MLNCCYPKQTMCLILIWADIVSTYSMWWFLPSCPFDSLH
uniref:Uncharacterized protein n=1 Tax=Arundo donax TaxID=35708 RepID=A0A0A9ALL3_ARUDO